MLWAITKFASLHSHIKAMARQLGADQRGVSGIVTAMSLTALMGFSGLAIDVVMWESNQRSMQGVADQAALAAATAFRNANETGAVADSTTAKNAAYATAIQSGYPAASVTLAAYNNGGSCTNDGCLRVTITQQQQRYFTRIFLSSNVNVSVTAVGTCEGCGNGSFESAGGAGDACVVALDPGGAGVTGSISASGTPTMSLSDCDLYNNSPNTSATILNGNATIEGCDATHPCGSKAFLAQPDTPSGQIDIPIVTGASPAPDPYASLVPPTAGGSCIDLSTLSQDVTEPNKVASTGPGTYCGGSTIKGTLTLNASGVYYFTGSLSLLAQANLQTAAGVQVTLYIQSGGFNSSAGATVNLTGPTTGALAGVTIWAAGGGTSSFGGGSSQSITGAVYAPQQTVSYYGGGSTSANCTRLIAGGIQMVGNSTATFVNSGCANAAGPVLSSSGLSGTTASTGSPILVQ